MLHRRGDAGAGQDAAERRREDREAGDELGVAQNQAIRGANGRFWSMFPLTRAPFLFLLFYFFIFIFLFVNHVFCIFLSHSQLRKTLCLAMFSCAFSVFLFSFWWMGCNSCVFCLGLGGNIARDGWQVTNRGVGRIWRMFSLGSLFRAFYRKPLPGLGATGFCEKKNKKKEEQQKRPSSLAQLSSPHPPLAPQLQCCQGEL